MNRRASRLPTWPLVLVACSLFVLSLIAPLAWKSPARPIASVDSSLSDRKQASEKEHSHDHDHGHRHDHAADHSHGGGHEVGVSDEVSGEELVAREAIADIGPVTPVSVAPAAAVELLIPDWYDSVKLDADWSTQAGLNWGLITADAPWDRLPAAFPGQNTLDPSLPQPNSPGSGVESASAAAQQSDAPKSAAPQSAEAVERATPSEPMTESAGGEAASGRVEVRPDAEATSAQPEAVWPRPATLYAELARLDSMPAVQEWRAAVERQLERLNACQSVTDPIVGDVIAALQLQLDRAPDVAEQLDTSTSRSQMLRTAYSVARRLSVWKMVAELAVREQASVEPSASDRKELEAATVAVREHIGRRPHADAWKKYLLSDELSAALATSGEPTVEQRDLIWRLLQRLDTTNLSLKQAEYLSAPVFERLSKSLRAYSQLPFDALVTLRALERFESSLNSVDARELARSFQTLHWSPRADESKYATSINDHYRNANVRVAIAGDLINRLLHEPHSSDDMVNDVVRQAQVSGRSHTQTKLRVELVPDRRQWRLGLEAKGDVTASTESRKGPATFWQDAWSNFNARKQLTVDRRGVRTERTEVKARSTSDLKAFETDYDGVPIFSLFARAIARQQYHEESAAAQAEIEQKVAATARAKLDTEIHQKLTDAEGEFHTKWLKPLQRIGLEPTAVDMETTEQRLIVRYRLAGGHQLGAHTPRPQAPGNSWLSVQIHESAANNAFAQLGLSGRRMKLDDLYLELAKKFDRPTPVLPDDLPEDVWVKFADVDPVRIRCDDGKVTITIKINELAQGKQHWRNFEVKATYVPVADQRDANLVRDGIIELSGERRSLGNRLALQGIFAKVLSKNRPINLVNHALAKKKELSDLQVNQFVIHDGWIGVALAPKPNTARVPYRQIRR